MPSSTAKRAQAIKARVNAQMHENVITTATDPRYQISRVPSGILTIDRLTLGGFARGRHVEIYGDFSMGKSLMVYLTMAVAQARGEVCALVDAEHVFDARWYRMLGGDPDSLLLYQPFTADELAKVLQLFVYGDKEVAAVDICGVDSVASLLPRDELEKDLAEGDDRIAALARLMSRLLRRVTTQNDKTLFLWTNQWREKIGPFPAKSSPGGLSLGFYCSTRIELMAGERENEEREIVKHGKWVKRKVPVGQWVSVRVTKEKTGARPLATKWFMLDLDTRRISRAREIIDLGMEDELVTRHGDYYEIVTPGEPIRAHGIKKAVRAIEHDPELEQYLTSLIEAQTTLIEESTDGIQADV
jgi:recombination protein RecA